MQINPKIKRRLIFQNSSFIALFLIVIALLALLVTVTTMLHKGIGTRV